jgi:hypothetical protein
MAAFAILLIPSTPDYMPSPNQLEETRRILEGFYPYRDGNATADAYPNYKFVTTGDAFEGFSCPSCSEPIDRFDEEFDEWWYGFEDQLLSSSLPKDEVITMQCCGNDVIARDINFGADAVFTRCLIRLREPGDDKDFSPSQLKELSDAFGCGLIQMTEVNG